MDDDNDRSPIGRARPAPLFDLSGRHVLITGAGSGIGRAIALGVSEAGGSVSLVDRDARALDDVAGEIGDEHQRVATHVCDVADRHAVGATVEDAERRLGPIHGLVNCAGIARRGPAAELSVEDWVAVIDVNLHGTFFCCQAVGRLMIKRRHGSIVNISSIAGQVGLRTGNANYAASKGGIDALTRTLAVEWATAGVRVNSIAPTHFRTPLVQKGLDEDPSRIDYFLGNIPLGRLGEPDELVGPAVFLLSDAASMVTGHVLNVDGGHTIA